MTRILNAAGAMSDHAHGSPQRESEAPSAPAETTSAPAAEDSADVRLIIEDDRSGAGFVYTTVDRRTGAVIRQLARDRLLELGEAPDYAAGALIKASV